MPLHLIVVYAIVFHSIVLYSIVCHCIPFQGNVFCSIALSHMSLCSFPLYCIPLCSINCPDITECLPTMTLVSNASSNMSSRCPHVVHEPKFTLEECKTEALAWRANVFNYRDGHCAVKHCKNNRLHLTDQQGGYDVYFLSGDSLL